MFESLVLYRGRYCVSNLLGLPSASSFFVCPVPLLVTLLGVINVNVPVTPHDRSIIIRFHAGWCRQTGGIEGGDYERIAATIALSCECVFSNLFNT